MIYALLGIFATANLTDIVFYDKIANRFREFFGVKHNEHGRTHEYEPKTGLIGFFQNVLKCYKCTSIWTAAFVTALFLISKKVFLAFSLWLSLSWFAYFLDREI